MEGRKGDENNDNTAAPKRRCHPFPFSKGPSRALTTMMAMARPSGKCTVRTNTAVDRQHPRSEAQQPEAAGAADAPGGGCSTTTSGAALWAERRLLRRAERLMPVPAPETVRCRPEAGGWGRRGAVDVGLRASIARQDVESTLSIKSVNGSCGCSADQLDRAVVIFSFVVVVVLPWLGKVEWRRKATHVKSLLYSCDMCKETRKHTSTHTHTSEYHILCPLIHLGFHFAVVHAK